MVNLRQTEILIGAQTFAILSLLFAIYKESQSNPFWSVWLSQNAPYAAPLLAGWIIITAMGALSLGSTAWILLLEREARDLGWKSRRRTAENVLRRIQERIITPVTDETPTRPIPFHSLLFLAIGAVALGASIVWRISILVFTGLGLIFIGLIPIYLNYEQRWEHPPSLAPYLRTLQHLLPSGVQVIYLPSLDDDKSSVGAYLMEPGHQVSQVLSISQETNLVRALGLKPVEAPGSELFRRIEEAMGVGFSEVKPSYLESNLPGTLVETLKVATHFSMVRSGDRFRVRLEGEQLATSCEMIMKLAPSLDPLGCEFCSAIALSLAKSVGRPIVIEDTVVDAGNSRIDTTYRVMGPVDYKV